MTLSRRSRAIVRGTLGNDPAHGEIDMASTGRSPEVDGRAFIYPSPQSGEAAVQTSTHDGSAVAQILMQVHAIRAIACLVSPKGGR